MVARPSCFGRCWNAFPQKVLDPKVSRFTDSLFFGRSWKLLFQSFLSPRAFFPSGRHRVPYWKVAEHFFQSFSMSNNASRVSSPYFRPAAPRRMPFYVFPQRSLPALDVDNEEGGPSLTLQIPRKLAPVVASRWTFRVVFPHPVLSEAQCVLLCDALFEQLCALCTRLVFHLRSFRFDVSTKPVGPPMLVRRFYACGFLELSSPRTDSFLRTVREFEFLTPVAEDDPVSTCALWEHFAANPHGVLVGPWSLGQPIAAPPPSSAVPSAEEPVVSALVLEIPDVFRSPACRNLLPEFERSLLRIDPDSDRQ